jgi:hypothetical protein
MKAVLAIVMLGSAAISPCTQPTPVVQPDAQVVIPEAGSACASACARMKRLHCPGWEGSPGKDGRFGTPDDDSCTVVCKNTERAAVDAPGISLKPACIARAKTCDSALDCYR